VADVTLTHEDALEFYGVHEGKWFQLPMSEQIEGHCLRAFEIEGKFAPRIMRRLIGPTNPVVAAIKAPGTIRGQFAEGDMVAFAKQKKVVDNCIHGSKNSQEAIREIEILKRSRIRPQ
jgi:nucleoside-diphosphate kinase